MAGTGNYENSAIDPRRAAELIRRTLKEHNRELPSVSAIAEDLRDPYRVLISTIISLRTKDEVTLAVSRRLFKTADTPQNMMQLTEDAVAQLIYPAGFYRTKARRILQISHILIDAHGGKVPDTREALLQLPGVGRKTANLTLNLGFGIDAVCVDTHVHRISNRLGWVTAKTPDETEQELEKVLPRDLWIPINEMLVAFGQMICTPQSPRCSQCPLDPDCPHIGVSRRR